MGPPPCRDMRSTHLLILESCGAGIPHSTCKCRTETLSRKKDLKNPHGNSIYHLVVEPVRVRWKSRNLIESSINELEEHQRWKVMT
jgi:hypothetical protein